MSQTVKESLLSIAGALAEVHAQAPSPALDVLHEEMWKGVNLHQEVLGLSDSDIDEIGQVGSATAARDGEPKKRPNQD